MALQDIDSVNLPASIIVYPDYTIPYRNFGLRFVSKKEYNGKYYEFGYTSTRDGNIGTVIVDFNTYLETFRLGIRQRIYENYSGITGIKLIVGFSKYTSGLGFTPPITESTYIDNFGLYLPDTEIQFATTTNFYNNFSATNLIDNYSVNSDNTISFSLNSSVYSLYENKAGSYVDLFLKEISEVAKPEFGTGMGTGIFFIGDYFKTEIYT
jgi:hypothetical protein